MSDAAERGIERLEERYLGELAKLVRGYFTELAIEPEFYRFDQDLAAPQVAYPPPRAGLWLARETPEAKAVGFLAIRPLANRTCEIKRLYVAPDARRRGWGQKLFDLARDFAREEGYREILLSVRPEQRAALAFCQVNHFNTCARYTEDHRAGIFLSYRFPAAG